MDGLVPAEISKSLQFLAGEVGLDRFVFVKGSADFKADVVCCSLREASNGWFGGLDDFLDRHRTGCDGELFPERKDGRLSGGKGALTVVDDCLLDKSRLRAKVRFDARGYR